MRPTPATRDLTCLEHDAIWDESLRIVREAGSMPLVGHEPWVESDDAYRRRIERSHIGSTDWWDWVAGDSLALDDVGKGTGLPRARLVRSNVVKLRN